MKRQSTNRTSRLVMAFGLNAAVAVAQLVGGLAAHSTGLLADAGHSVTDIAALGVALVAVRWARRPRDPQRTFGYHRGTILAALASVSITATVTAAVVTGAIERLLHPHAVSGGLMVSVAAASLVVNALAALVLFERSRDLNMRAATLHMAGDALASLAVIAAGALIVAAPSLRWADPLSSLTVAGLILLGAFRILRSSLNVLLESAPRDIDLASVIGSMSSVSGVAEVHDLHVWSISSDIRALSAHLVLKGHPTLEEAQAIGDTVKLALASPYGIAHTTLELECERCEEGLEDPCLIDAVAGGRPAARP